MNYFYFEYSDISGTSISEVSGGIIYQDDACLNGLSVAQCATFGTQLIGTNMGDVSANLMVLTTDNPSIAGKPRLQFYSGATNDENNDIFFPDIYYLPSNFSTPDLSNNNKQLFFGSPLSLSGSAEGEGLRPEDQFGASLDINDNNKIVVGAPLYDTTGDGAVYFYDFNNNSLSFNVKQVGPTGGRKGNSVSINNNNYAVVGVPGIDSNKGVINIYSGNNFATIQQINANAIAGSFYRFGEAVDINDNKLIVGAPGTQAAGITEPFVRIYEYNSAASAGTEWSLATTLFSPQYSLVADNFGAAVTLSDTLILVGAPNYNTPDVSGVVYLYDINNPSSSPDASFGSMSPIAYSYFGASVAATLYNNYNIIAIGMPGHPDKGVPSDILGGTVRIFTSLKDSINTADWTLTTDISGNQNTGSYGDGFGNSVSLSSNAILVIGAPYEDTSVGNKSGAIYIYTTINNGTSWILNNRFIDTDSNDLFGFSTSINNSGTVLSGAPNNYPSTPDGSGAFFIYSNNYNIFEQIIVTSTNITGAYDISFSNEIQFFQNKWADNGDLPDVSSSYFQWSDITDNKVDFIVYNSPQFVDISENYAKCATWATQFLGTIGLKNNSEVLNLGIPSAISFETDFGIWYFEGLSNSVISAALNINFTSYTARLYSSNGDSYFLDLSLNNPTSQRDPMTGEILEGLLLIYPASGVYPVPNPSGLFPYGTPITANWYFEYNTSFASFEEKERKYFVLYTDENDASNLRIQFYHDISGAYFDPSNVGPNYNQQVFTSLPETSFVSLANNYDFSMSYATPLYFTESTWLANGSLVAPDSNFYFQWSDISGYTISDIPIGGAFDGSSVQQMASYGTSFLGQTLVDTNGIPRECKYFILYTNDLSENRIEFKYDASGVNAGAYYSPETQDSSGLNYNKQIFCSSANAIVINEISNNDIVGGFDCSFSNEIKFFENQWADNGELPDISYSYFQWSDISDNKVDFIVYNSPQFVDISENYAKCATWATQFLGTIGFDPNNEEKERKYFVLYTDETDPSNLRIQFYHDTGGAYFDPSNIGSNYNQQIFTSLPDTSFVSLANTYDFSMSYATPLYFTESTWLANGGLTDSSSSYFMWSDISGYTISDIPLGGAFDGSSVQQMASYGTSFLGQTLVDTNGIPRECKYFILYTNDLSENRIEFKYDISGINAGGYFNNNTTGPNYNQQIFTALQDTSAVSNSVTNLDFSMSYATPLYFTQSTWTPNGGLIPPDSNFYFQWSDISGYTINDIPVGGAFDGSSIAQMASYGTSFLGQILVDLNGIPRECKYFILYTNDLSENRIQFKYDASGNNAGVFYSPKTQYYNGLNYNKQVFCSSANAIIINDISNNNITGGFDCLFANEIKFFEDKWADNNQLVAPATTFLKTTNIIAQYDGSANPQVDIISYNAPQLTGISNNYAECAGYASKFFGTTGLTDPSGTGNWEEKERKYFILIHDNTDPSSARIQFKYDGSGAYYDPNCQAGGLALNTQIFCPTTDVVQLQAAPGPNYEPYLTTIGTNTMSSANPQYFSG